jgi:hypothetical protein
MNLKLDRYRSLLGDSGRGDKNVDLAELLDSRVHGILHTLVVAHVDLMENDGHAILGREVGDSLISVLLQHVENDKGLKVDVAKGVRNTVSESTSTTREESIVRFETSKTMREETKFSLTQSPRRPCRPT